MALLNGCWLTSPLATLTILEGSLVSIGTSCGRTRGLLHLVGFKSYLESFQMRRLSLVSADTQLACFQIGMTLLICSRILIALPRIKSAVYVAKNCCIFLEDKKLSRHHKIDRYAKFTSWEKRHFATRAWNWNSIKWVRILTEKFERVQ